jgi:hypothetical protein
LPPACIYSLKHFHSVFFEKYREAYPSLLLIEDCCDHFENFIQELESAYGDEEFMDDELLDALNENPFHHHEKIMDSTLDDNELEQNSSKDDIDLPSYEVDNNLQQSCQSSSDQDIYKDVLSSFPSFLSSSEFLIQEEICADQNFEFACIETLESHDLSIEVKNSVQQVCCLEFDEHVQQPSNDQDIEFFQSLDNSFSDIHEKPLVDICVDVDLATSIEDLQEHTNLVSDLDGMEDHIVAFPFKKDQPNEEEQSAIIFESISLLFVDQQEVMFHDFQDPLGSLLQASEKVEFVLFTNTGFGLRFHFELPFTQSFFMLVELNTSISQVVIYLIGYIGSSTSLDQIIYGSVRVGKV